MRENHIIRLLEEKPLGSLTASELDIVKAHTASCPDCLHAYEAAQTSLLMLRELTSVIVEPSAFFQTKVLAAIREQNRAPKQLEYLKMWQTASPLVALIGALIVMLLALTFFTDSSQQQSEPSNLASINDDSPEWMVVDRNESDDNVTSSQALAIIYDPELDAGGAYGKQP
jgi:hypothetical protein